MKLEVLEKNPEEERPTKFLTLQEILNEPFDYEPEERPEETLPDLSGIW